MHLSLLANNCRLHEHLTIVNAMVGQHGGNSTVYVTAHRTDNAAASEVQAVKNVGRSDQDYVANVEMVKPDSFFPSGTRVQNLKIDVQGQELQVLLGAERLLTENKGRLRVRYEFHEGLLRAAGTEPSTVVDYMLKLGYEIYSKGDDIDMM